MAGVVVTDDDARCSGVVSDVSAAAVDMQGRSGGQAYNSSVSPRKGRKQRRRQEIGERDREFVSAIALFIGAVETGRIASFWLDD
jgi:hypothetical protein